MSYFRPNNFLTSLLIISVTIVIASEACPYQLCTCNGSSIFCTGSGYTVLPQINDTGDEFTHMEITMITLKEIPDHSLPNNLQFLKIYTTPIDTIGSHAFDQIGKTLQHLDLSGPLFTKIPDAFSDLTNLIFFHMEYSVISDWNVDAIKQMGPTLQTLEFINVGLTSWPGWMQYFTALQTIEFSLDPILSIPDDAFDAFKESLRYWTSTAIGLTEMSKAFSSLTNVEQIFIPENKITEFKNLPQSTKLNSLALSGNNFASSDSMAQNLLAYANTLGFLDVSRNKLTGFPDFSRLSVLKTLSMDSNRLSDPKTQSLPLSLSAVFMRNNSLTKIPLSSSFTKLHNAEFTSNNITELNGKDISAELPGLVISSNQITGLQQTSFPQNSSLTNLDISSNPLTNISNQAFKNLGRLKTLNLQDTKMTRLPMTLSYLTSLKTLSLAKNPNLICTCGEAGLLTWYKSLPNLSIDGTCGNMTVTDFFVKYAPKCH